ncbi:MAG: NAD(+)/NADH kinase, partial [Bacteroidales bacterium]|nr:NAD(+)/NADH kinase [Bacteroidales bacterium]
TPTGSTAYSLSVGGPIVTPNADVLIIAPVAPHNLNVRPIITPAESEITITFSSKSEPTGTITMDNRSFDAPVGSRFVISRAGHTAKCISFGNRGFIDAIREKLLWGEDRRNNF